MSEATNEELHRQIRAYEATVHNLNLQLEAVGAGGVHALGSAPSEPMDWRLPCDVTVGHVTMRKGVRLGALVARMKSLYEMATGRNADEVANRTIEQRAALMDSFRARVAAPSQTPIGVVESAVPGAGGFHVCLAAGAQVPPVGEKLYLAAAPKLEVPPLANGDKLQVIARQVLRDMKAQDVLHEWHDLLAEALDSNAAPIPPAPIAGESNE